MASWGVRLTWFDCKESLLVLMQDGKKQALKGGGENGGGFVSLLLVFCPSPCPFCACHAG